MIKLIVDCQLIRFANNKSTKINEIVAAMVDIIVDNSTLSFIFASSFPNVYLCEARSPTRTGVPLINIQDSQFNDGRRWQ